MKHTRWFLFFVLAAAFAVLPACSDDDPVDPGAGNDNPPADTELTDALDLQLPQALVDGTTPQAQAIEGQLQGVQLQLETMLGMFGEPDGPPVAEKDGTWTYTWTWSDGTDAATVVLVVAETATGYSWAMTLGGTFDGETYADFVFYTAEMRKDGSEGSCRARHVGTEPPDWDFVWEWSTANDGTFTMSMTSDATGDEGRIEFVVNPDGSGSLRIYDRDGAWILRYEYTWTVSGAGGTFTEYDDNGDPVDEEDWGDSEPSDDPVVPPELAGNWTMTVRSAECGQALQTLYTYPITLQEGQEWAEIFDIDDDNESLNCNETQSPGEYTFACTGTQSAEGCTVTWDLSGSVTWSETNVLAHYEWDVDYSAGCGAGDAYCEVWEYELTPNGAR